DGLGGIDFDGGAGAGDGRGGGVGGGGGLRAHRDERHVERVDAVVEGLERVGARQHDAAAGGSGGERQGCRGAGRDVVEGVAGRHRNVQGLSGRRTGRRDDAEHDRGPGRHGESVGGGVGEAGAGGDEGVGAGGSEGQGVEDGDAGDGVDGGDAGG